MEDINTRYNQDIEDFFEGKLTKYSISCGCPGDILCPLIKSKNLIEISTAKLALKRDLHGLRKEHLLNLPELINDPLMVLKYSDDGSVISIVSHNFNDEGILVVGLSDNSKIFNQIEIIEIITIHGRRVSQLIKSIENDKLLYINKEKLEKFFSDSGFNSLKSEKLLELIPDKDTTKKYDSDTVNKKNNSEELGAVEVIEQNTYADVSGFVPTYKILSSYDQLFDNAGYDFPAKKGGLEATLQTIKEVISRYNHQAARIAAHLKADTLKQSAFNIWHFCVNNISYKLDKEGYEELRTPNRTWHDRFTGVDCDDFAIFSSCILLQMGFAPELAVVAFNNNAQFGHIYTVVGSQLQRGPYNLGQHNGGAIGGGIVVDPVLRTIFNKHPKGITKARIMNIQVLNGIAGDVVRGFGAVEQADATTVKLMEHYEKLKILKRKKQATPAMKREMRKLRFMIFMNGMPERNLYLEVMPLVYDIDRYGQFQFLTEESANAVIKFLDETVGKGLTEKELVYEDGVAVQVMKGLGANALGELGARKKIFKKLKEKVKQVVDKVKDTVKDVAQKVKETGAKVKDAVVRYNPATILVRNSFLMLLSLNFRNIARQLYIALMSSSELQAAGYTAGDQAAMKKAYTKVQSLFEKIGGKKENLISTIKKAKSKKPLFGKPKEKDIQTANKSGRISGLGEPITIAAVTAAIATATPLIAVVVKGIKDSGIFLKKEDKDETSVTEDATPTQLQEYENMFANGQLGPDGRKSANYDSNLQEDDDNDDDELDGKDNTLLYVGGAVVGLTILGIAMSSKTK